MVTSQGCSVLHYSVDGEQQEAREHELTPREIVQRAGLDPKERYLVGISGKEQQSFKNQMDAPIHLRDHLKLITVFSGAVTVS